MLYKLETGVGTGTGFFATKKPGTGCRDEIELFSATGIGIRNCNLFGLRSRFKIFETKFFFKFFRNGITRDPKSRIPARPRPEKSRKRDPGPVSNHNLPLIVIDFHDVDQSVNVHVQQVFCQYQFEFHLHVHQIMSHVQYHLYDIQH